MCLPQLCTEAGNCGHLRCVLLMLLVMCKNGAWLLEQPAGSLLASYHRWDWFCNRIAKASTYSHTGPLADSHTQPYTPTQRTPCARTTHKNTHTHHTHTHTNTHTHTHRQRRTTTCTHTQAQTCMLPRLSRPTPQHMPAMCRIHLQMHVLIHVSFGSARCRYAASCQVYTQSLWMALHDAPSAKRTVLFSSMATISSLDLGRLSRAERERRTSLATVRFLAYTLGLVPINRPNPQHHANKICCSGRFIDKRGVARFRGDKEALQKSGTLA